MAANANSILNKCMSKGNKTGNIANKIVNKKDVTGSAVHKIIGKDTDKEDRKIPGTVCKRCGGKKQIRLGRNIIACPVCKGKGKY